ncbi:hypothetical protein RQP46_003990 [Phenoliferia psychrophenolica]
MAPLVIAIDPSATKDVQLPSTGFVPGDVLAIRPTQPHANGKDRPLLFKVPLPDEGIESSAQQQKGRRNKANVVLSPAVAQSFGWAKTRTEVDLQPISKPPPPELVASHVELYFANIYLGRADMFRLSLSLVGSALFYNQRITLPGSSARVRVGRLYNTAGKVVRSACVDAETKIVFRSESARCFVFVEVSAEMWQFEEDGSLLREKCELFLGELFAQFYDVQPPTSHTVSIVLYGRVIYDDGSEAEEERAPLSQMEDGTPYRDFYKVVLDLTPSPPASIVRSVVLEISRWQEMVLLRTRPSGEQKLAGRIAFAHESNMLEAINLALNSFEEHWIDRDLQRTGLSLIVITAGTSFYQVDKSLLRATTERMLSHGVGLDVVSLSKTPLHTVPLFSFRSHEPGLADEASLLSRNLDLSGGPHAPSKSNPHPASSFPSDQRDPLYYDSPRASQEKATYYAEPLFVFCAFFGIQVDKPHRIDRFMPRARCYELFSQGIGERIPIALPLLQQATQAELDGEWTYLSEQEKRIKRRERYDAEAVGAKPELAEMGTWERASGVSELSMGSGSGSGSGPPLIPIDPLPKKKSAKPHALPPQMPPSPLPTPASPTPSNSRRRGDFRAPSTAIPITGTVERSRGRERRLSDAESRRVPSLTPVGRRPRSPSIGAGSIRTVSTRSGTTRSSATPALIARLTANMAAPAATGTAATVAPSSRPSWLGIFNRSTPAPAVLAPSSTIVQKVEAVANVAPEFDLESAPSVVDSSSTTTGGSSVASSSSPSLGTTGSSASRPTPTQPISISTRAAQTREADRPSTTKKATPTAASSYTNKIFAPLQNDALRSSRASGRGSGTSLLNPSKPGKRSVGLADQARRWASIFIRHSNDQRDVNWVSITRGACLPMTTDYLPSADDLTKNYSDFRYSVPTSSTSSSFLLRTDIAQRSPVLELMTEIISQRLSHGFQICTPANAIGALDAVNLASSKTIADVMRDMQSGETTAIYLSLASQIHRISYDRRTQSVAVKILRRRQTWAKEPYSYSALVWTQGSSKYEHTNVKFPYPAMIDPVDWQLLDRLVAGDVKEDHNPALRHRRTRLVLLPAEHVPDREYLVSKTPAFEAGEVTDEDIQYQGFLTLMALIQSLRWVAPGGERDVTDVQTTTKFAPEWAAEMGSKAILQGEASGQAVPRPSGWLRRVTALPPSTNPRDESVASNPSTERDRSPSPSRSSTAEPTPSTPKTPRPTVHMTYSVVLDLDLAKKSDRAERVVCHYDRSHNSRAAYHIELTWLAGSGKIIDNTIQSWTRQVARWGLNLIEVSTRPVDSDHNPFQRATRVPLALPPPPTSDASHHRHHYETSLLSSLGFFLDIGADDTFPDEVDVQYSYRRNPAPRSQYIHRTGTLLVSILGGEQGFNYVPNRIFLSHAPGPITAEDVVKSLVELCSDETRLEELWKKLTPAAGAGLEDGGVET